MKSATGALSDWVSRLPGVPVVFAAPRSLRATNAVAIAGALAACTAAAFMHLMNQSSWTWGLVAGVPTFVVGGIWARLLHSKRTTTRSGIRLGWLLSVPLAALNGALSGAMFLLFDGMGGNGTASIGAFIGGGLLGLTFGVIFWAPALVLVLILFGLPIARAQQLAARGLAGEDRGERTVGIAAVVLGTLSLLAAYHASGHDYVPASWTAFSPLGVVMLHVFAGLGIVFGTTAAVRATAREKHRQRFVARVEALEEPGFRVEPTPEGKVLLRVPLQESYREAAIEEEVFRFDQASWK